MRFPAPLPPGTIAHRLSNRRDWPLSGRLLFTVLPIAVLISIGSAWAGYTSSSSALYESMSSTPLMEAKAQALAMSNDLERLREGLSLISRKNYHDESTFHESLPLVFRETLSIVAETGYKTPGGEGFVLLQENGKFREASMVEIAKNAYSASHQLLTLPVRQDEITIFPAVINDAPDNGESVLRRPVMRLATRAPGSQDILFIGIDLAAWAKKLSRFTSERSPLRTPVQEGALQLAYFFDTQGWILFEMSNFAESENIYPDMARKGFSGDLGRPGFDAAFRPAAAHTNFWEMVVGVKDDISGRQRAPAGLYAPAYSNSWAFLCFAPVALPALSDEAQPAVPIGGIAFFETSALPKTAFHHIASVTLVTGFATFFILGLFLYRAGRSISRPLRRMTTKLDAMQGDGTFGTFSIIPVCEEHQRLQSGINGIVIKAMGISKELERLKSARLFSRSQLPVDFSDLIANPAPASEYELVGSSKVMRYVREQLRKAARTGADVLVWGETGTGKELVASAIHKAGNHSDGPFISINCGALDENLLLDALFGHVKGAFSEARSDRKGAFLAADGGTLHLDEIANASLKVQQSLLRALAVRRIRPLGTDMEIPFNARVVAATNIDLRECVRRGTFREDLYYRLAIISIKTPALREHKEDIPELAAHYIHAATEQLGVPDARLSRGALEVLTSYDWPGNVRELRNCLTRALAFAEGDIILSQHIALEYDAYAPIRLPALEQEAPVAEEEDTSNTLPADYIWPAPPRTAPTAGDDNMENSGKTDSQADQDALGDIVGADGLPRDLNRRQRKGLQIILVQGGITRSQYEDIVGKNVTSRTVQNDLKQLVEWGVLARKGAGRSTYYVLRSKQAGKEYV